MKSTKGYYFAVIICVLAVLLWLYRSRSAEGARVERSPGGKSSVTDGVSTNGEVESPRERQRENGRSATREPGLTARARQTAIQGMLDGNADLIRQAISTAPNDPYLLFVGATNSLLTPEEHLEMGKRFHERDPDNAFAAFVHASHLLKTGDSAAALAILGSSGACSEYSDYLNETGRLMEAARIEAGDSTAEAKLTVFSKLEAGYYVDLRNAVDSLVQIAGDLPAEEAASMRSLASYMSRRISDESKSGTVIRQMVGLAMEKSALGGMAGDQPSPYDGLTVAEARKSIDDQRQLLIELNKQVPDLEQLRRDDPQLLELYLDRSIQEGEVEALKWLRDNR